MTTTRLIRQTAWLALGCLTCVGALTAQDQQVRGPVAGYLFDKSAGIRSIQGVPGAATLGRPVGRGAAFDAVLFSPVRDYAVALLPRVRQAVLLTDLGGSVQAGDLPARSGVSRVAISPSGDAAALYYPEGQSVAVITGLPDSPVAQWNLDLPPLGGEPAALAVSDGGGAVLVAPAGEPAQIWLLAPGSIPTSLGSAVSSPSLAFLSKSNDIVMADRGAGTVLLVRDPMGRGERTQIGGTAQGIFRPVAVSATADNRSVLVANADPAGVVVLSLAGEEPLWLACSSTPTGLDRLSGGSVFRLNGPGEGPVWLLDANDSPPRIVFVPDSSPAFHQPRRTTLPIRVGVER